MSDTVKKIAGTFCKYLNSTNLSSAYTPPETSVTWFVLTVSALALAANIFFAILLIVSARKDRKSLEASALSLNLSISNALACIGYIITGAINLSIEIENNSDVCDSIYTVMTVGLLLYALSVYSPGAAHALIAVFYYVATQRPLFYRSGFTWSHKVGLFSFSWLSFVCLTVVYVVLLELAGKAALMFSLVFYIPPIAGCMWMWWLVFKASRGADISIRSSKTPKPPPTFRKFILTFTLSYVVVTTIVFVSTLIRLILSFTMTEEDMFRVTYAMSTWIGFIQFPFLLRLLVEPFGYICWDTDLKRKFSGVRVTA